MSTNQPVTVAVREPESFELNVPLAIVGGGAWCLTAALAARTAGLPGESVWVLERDATPSGSTAMSYGAICAADTQAQLAENLSDSAATLLADILAASRGETDSGLAELIARESGPSMNWLTNELKLPLTLMTNWTGLGHSVPRLHAPASRSGKDLMGMLLNAAQDHDIQLVTEARVTTLFVNAAKDRITGVGIDRRGDHEALGCEALIMASCGYGGNPALIREHIPAMANGIYYGHEGNTGDALQWGLALGAETADLGAYQALGSLASPSNVVIPHTLLIDGGVQINTLGLRFENELENISGQALDILAQPDGLCWIVYDERLHQRALLDFQEYRDGDAIGISKTGNTIEELAARTQLPAKALASTLAAVAAHKSAGTTDEFGRNFENVAALQAPYYAIKVTGALFHTQGGLCIDAKARVKRQQGNVFENLFAGGGAARSVSGPGIWGYLPGMGLCTAVTLGRVAGQSAAHLLKAQPS